MDRGHETCHDWTGNRPSKLWKSRDFFIFRPPSPFQTVWQYHFTCQNRQFWVSRVTWHCHVRQRHPSDKNDTLIMTYLSPRVMYRRLQSPLCVCVMLSRDICHVTRRPSLNSSSATLTSIINIDTQCWRVGGSCYLYLTYATDKI